MRIRRFLAGIPVLFLGAVLVQSVFATTYVINDGGRTFSCTLYTASTREAIMKLYEERYPLYNKYCDVRTDASGSALEVLEAVKEDFLNEDFSY